jgi:hypothetical protein
MAYIRKTVDEFEIQGFYSGAWECVNTEDTRTDGRRSLREYRTNELGTSFRLRVIRTPKP